MAPEMVPFNLSLGIDQRLWREDVAAPEAESGQDLEDVVPLRGKICPQNCSRLPPLVNLVVCAQEIRH